MAADDSSQGFGVHRTLREVGISGSGGLKTFRVSVATGPRV